MRFICFAAVIFATKLIQVNAQDSVVVSVNFTNLQQGTAGTIRLSGSQITHAVVSALGHLYPCFMVAHDLTCLIAAPMDAKIGQYPLQITMNDGNSDTTWSGTFSVTSGQFLTGTQVILPNRLLYLLGTDIELNENKRLLSIYSRFTPDHYWDGQFLAPVSGNPVSSFGNLRAYNDGLLRRHTGYDLRVPEGTPIRASGNGRVVFARPLDIHGNIVVIDHGEGIFSSYAHLKAIYVVPGQFVLQSDIIGLSGTTGRSTGPHVHWEMAVDGIWINPIAFEQLRNLN